MHLNIKTIFLIFVLFSLFKLINRLFINSKEPFLTAAFSIIEILVVISVISILIGIGVPRLQGMQEESLRTRARAELKTLKLGIESYYINRTPLSYPAPTGPGTLSSSVLNSARPLIVDKRLFDPFYASTGGCSASNAEYRYFRSPNGLYYVVHSRGPNRVADITGISNAGILQGVKIDDIYETNGKRW